jgi:hypothetical protein
MTGQGSSHGWSWKGIGPPTGEPGIAIQNEFSPTKGLYYRQKYSSASSYVQVAGLIQSRRWRSQMWRSWAGMVTRALWQCGRLDVLPNSLKQRWRPLMVEKLTFNYLATALLDIPAVCMTIPRSLKTWDIVALCCVTKLHILECTGIPV